MNDESSPRPWFVNGHSIEANDPDGLWLQNEKTGRGVVANLPSCPKHRMSAKNRKTWDAIVEANAALIVDAVNFYDATVDKQLTALLDERDRLRDIVRKSLEYLGEINELNDREDDRLDSLVAEARAAIGEDAP